VYRRCDRPPDIMPQPHSFGAPLFIGMVLEAGFRVQTQSCISPSLPPRSSSTTHREAAAPRAKNAFKMLFPSHSRTLHATWRMLTRHAYLLQLEISRHTWIVAVEGLSSGPRFAGLCGVPAEAGFQNPRTHQLHQHVVFRVGCCHIRK